jgi:hypothetical protein
MKNMHTLKKSALAAWIAAFAAIQTASAAVTVNLSPTPLGGGVFSFNVSVTNSGPDDVVRVSLLNGPTGDPLVMPTAPTGYLASYDSGLGILDLLEDTQPFASGTTTQFFTFNSTTSSGFDFTSFEYQRTNGDVFTGIASVPEPSRGLLLMASLSGLIMVRRKPRPKGAQRTVMTVAALALMQGAALASSHSDAPLIKQDPQANLTDVYAFIGTKYDNPSIKVLNVLVSVRPFSEPGDGAAYERFADDALYSIHITHPTTGAQVLRYDFRFSDINPLTTPGLKNPNTILSYGLGTAAGAIQATGDAQQNYTQTYTVLKDNVQIATNLQTPPPNLGGRTTPKYNDVNGNAVSGAATFAALDDYTRLAVQTLSDGTAVFAGPREDGFFADTSGIFDLLDGRILATTGTGVDGFKGFNVLTYAIQIPITSLPSFAYTAAFADLGSGSNPLPSVATANGVGVYASVSRPRNTLRRTDGEPVNSGPFIQVNRQGNPLFNEVLVAHAGKDPYNRSLPTGDAAFGTYATNSELAFLINVVVFGTANGLSPLATTNRGDLNLVFIPDVIRVDTTTAAVRLPGDSGFERRGFAGGDTTTDSSGRVKSSGWPNGRRVGDDVVDIALIAVASGPSYSPVTVLGDNVNANDQLYHRVFPYLGTPHAGSRVNQRQAP